MRSITRLTGLLVLLGGVLIAAAQRRDSVDTLMGAGLHEEQVEDNCKEAIKIYQRIVGRQDTPREIAARAWLHIGLCQERLGQLGAREAYERVVQRYADLAEFSAQARLRLEAGHMTAPPIRRPAMSPIRVANAGPNSGLSGAGLLESAIALTRDGRSAISSTEIRDLQTGRVRQFDLAMWGTCRSPYNDFRVVPSTDGRRVAYTCTDRERTTLWGRDLRVITLDPPSDEQPKVLVHDPELRHLVPFAWSLDDKEVFAVLRHSDFSAEIVAVSTTSGTRRLIKRLEWWQWPDRLTLSPDGRYIAYDRPVEMRSRNRDLFALASDGATETAIVQDPSLDTHAVWTPDGNAVAFISDRSGVTGLWLVHVRLGKPAGTATVLRANTGTLRPVGFTRDGSFHYVRSGIQRTGITTVAVDPDTDKALGVPARLDRRYAAENWDPTYSPDGRSIAYLSAHRDSVFVTVVIRSLETGEERELPTALRTASNLRWLPDGSSLLLLGGDYDRDNLSHLHRIDVRSGRDLITRLIPSGNYQLSPDGKVVYLVRGVTATESGLFAVSLDEQSERELVRGTNVAFSIAPDGTQLAVMTGSRDAAILLPASGGAGRRLNLPEGSPQSSGRLIGWSSDRRSLLWSVQRVKGDTELWAVPTDGREPTRTSERSVSRLGLHPSGTQRASNTFDSYDGENEPAVWVYPGALRAVGRSVLTARIDARTSVVTGVVSVLTQDLTALDRQPKWSPDGQRVAFVRMRGSSSELVVRALSSGTERSYSPAGAPPINGHVWFHDGKSILLAGSRLDLATSTFTPLPSTGTLDGAKQISRDDRVVYTLVRDASSGQLAVSALELTSGTTTRAVVAGASSSQAAGRDSSTVASCVLRLSPDGRTLATVHDTAGGVRLSTFSVTGSSYRDLYTFTAPSRLACSLMSWTKDGSAILISDLSPANRIIRIPAAGGEPQFTGLALGNVEVPETLDLSPDGTRLVFGGRVDDVSVSVAVASKTPARR